MMLTLCVDYLLISGSNDKTVAKVLKTLVDEFTITDDGDLTQVLGIAIIQDKERSTISISRGPNLISLLDNYGMTDCNPVHTPAIGNKLTAEPKSSVPLCKENTIENQNIVGSPLFLCKCTHIDIFFAAQFMRKPTSVHVGAVKRTLPYLHGTSDLHITYSRNSNFEHIDFCDASYGTDNPKMARFTSRSMYFVSRGGSFTSAQAHKR